MELCKMCKTLGQFFELLYIRQLLIAVIIPKMLYALGVFATEKLTRKTDNTGQIGKLARVQQLTTILITGAM